MTTDSLSSAVPAPGAAVVDGEATVHVRGLGVSTLDLAAASGLIVQWASEMQPRLVVTPNTDHFLRWQEDETFRRLYERADLRTVDGAPVAALARWESGTAPSRVTGVDLFIGTAERAAEARVPIVIIGGLLGVAEAAARRLMTSYPGLDIAFTESPTEIELRDPMYLHALAARLAAYPTKIVALCLGSPKQEQLFADLERVSGTGMTGVYLCVGATADFLAGRIRRAPDALRRVGLEWLYRLAREPRRLWRRYLVKDVQIVKYFLNAPRSRGDQAAERPHHVDRLIVHQFDPANPVPGGIDTCIRGLIRYMPADVEFAVVGVAGGDDPSGRELGRWEHHSTPEGRPYWFMPVARLDSADQRRVIPHSLRLMAGVARYRRQLPTAEPVQVHRMDTAAAAERLLRRPLAYFVHTQDGGLTGAPSDSYWRYAAGVHRNLEGGLVRRARSVVVFNEDYAGEVQKWNPRACFSPTWSGPAVLSRSEQRDPNAIVWAGRLEKPKDPLLAIDAFAHLVGSHGDQPWSLTLLGDGSMRQEVERHVAALPEAVRTRIRIAGRVPQAQVASTMGSGGVFLMTSFAGYEGYPRVLVEALASGLPAVVTEGADTGGLVVDDSTGFTLGRDPEALGAALAAAAGLDRGVVEARVAPLDAPSVVQRIIDDARVPSS